MIKHTADERRETLQLVRIRERGIGEARDLDAEGLMQLMPATARWMAGKSSLKGSQMAIAANEPPRPAPDETLTLQGGESRVAT